MSATGFSHAMWAVVLSVPMLSCAATESATLADYRPIAGLEGNLASVGSDTMNNMMSYWMESFRKHYPKVNVDIEGKGTGTAFPCMIEGHAQIGMIAREPKPAEQDKFEEKFGYRATVLNVAQDALAIYVHKDNPMLGITLEQLDAVFSDDRKRGYKEDIRTWGQLGLEGEWADRPIVTYGRNSASGAYSFLRNVVLKGGNTKETVKEMLGSASVVQAVTEDRYGIGYSGTGYSTSGVRRLKLAEKEGAPFIEANAENIYNGTYPFRRFLSVVINKDPGRPLLPLIREFCLFMFSKQGQEIVDKDGYFPLTVAIVREELKKIGIEK